MLLHSAHWDDGNTPPDWTLGGTSTAPSTTTARTGAYSCLLPSYSADFNKNARLALSSGLAELYFQFGYCATGSMLGSSYTKLLKWESSGGTALGGLKINNVSGLIEVYTGNFSSLVATGVNVINTGVWYCIEVHIVLSDAGSITVRVGLNEDSTYSGDTKPGADTTINYLRWGNAGAGNTYIDDILVFDTTGSQNNSWPNGAKIAYLAPTGDGSPTDFTCSTGSDHYALVDEVPASSTDYLQAGAADVEDKLTLPNLDANADVIRAVIPQAYALKGSSSAPTTLKVGYDIGAGSVLSSALALNLSAGKVSNLWETKPAGGGDFSVSDVNGMSLCLKSAA